MYLSKFLSGAPVLLLFPLIAADIEPPIAKKIPKELTQHGDKRVDNYFWLRDKSRPEVIEYLEGENAYTSAVMKHTEPLQEKIYQEILGRTKQTDLSVPVRDRGYYYYSRTEEGKQYPIFCRKKGSLTAAEEILLDANELAKGKSAFALGAFAVSEDQKLLGYSVDDNGSEQYTIHVKDLGTGTLLPDEVTKCSTGLTWANDNKTLFYTTFDATKRPEKVHRHILGGDPKNDEVVFTESDTVFSFGVQKSRSKKFIFIQTANASKTSEILYLDADKPSEPFKIMHPRTTGLEYYADHQGDHFLIRTNDGGATNFKLMSAPLADPSKQNWKEMIPHSADVTLDDIDTFKNFLVLHTRENGLPCIRVTNVTSGESHAVSFPEPAYAVFPNGNEEYDTTLLRFNYTSLITPPSIFDYDMQKQTRELKKRTEVVGGYDPSKYVSERIYATARDGKKVPISLVYRKGLKRDGNNPLLLNGYGSYGINSDPTFSIPNLSLLDRGFVVAIAHVRGGAEYGRGWFEDGRMLHKRNSFTDFIACGEYLVAQKFTSSRKMAARGGSAGGLLMGAVINLAPDLFHTVIAAVPFVDVISTMSDPSIPLTTGEYDQWGNPDDKKYYEYMKSYSPYDNVEHKSYPNLLVTTGLNDPRVAYWEPAKWVAKLRALKSDNNRLLLKTQMGAGHGGPSGRYERMHETAFFEAFMLDTLGINE